MKRIYDFSSFSRINEADEATGATGAAGATGATPGTGEVKDNKDAPWYSYLEAIINGVVSESYMPMVQLAAQGSYKNTIADLESVEKAETLEDQKTALEKILANASGAINSKDIGYDKLKEISEGYKKAGEKYISALPVLKEKSQTDGKEIRNSISALVELIVKKMKENKPSDKS